MGYERDFKGMLEGFMSGGGARLRGAYARDEGRDGRSGDIVLRVKLPKDVTVGLAEGRGLCLRLEVGHAAADSSEGD